MTINYSKNIYEHDEDAIEFIKNEYPSLIKECDDETYKELLRMHLGKNYLKMLSSVEVIAEEKSYIINIKYANLESLTIKRNMEHGNKIQLKAHGKSGLSEYYIENYENYKLIFRNWKCSESEYNNSKFYKDGMLVSEKSYTAINNHSGKDITYQYYFVSENNILYSKKVLEFLGRNIKREFYAYADVTDVDIESFGSFDKMKFLNWHSIESEEYNKANNEFNISRRKNK